MRPLRVLLVEDSRLICDRLRESISMMPVMSVTGAVDNQVEALAMLKQSRVDVVLLDLHLRHGTGFGVLRAINNGDADNAVTIVFTNHDLGEYRRAASALGAQHFLDKLRDFDRLPDLLQQIRNDLDDGDAGECN